MRTSALAASTALTFWGVGSSSSFSQRQAGRSDARAPMKAGLTYTPDAGGKSCTTRGTATAAATASKWRRTAASLGRASAGGATMSAAAPASSASSA